MRKLDSVAQKMFDKMTRNRKHLYTGLVAISAVLILSINLTADGQGAGRPTPTPNKPPTSKPTTPTRKPSTTRSSTPAFRPTNPHIELVKIPPGTFMMGSTKLSAFDNPYDKYQKPIHQVTIDYPFYIGKYEITQAQWHAIMGNDPSNHSLCGGNCPVEQVSWNAAQDFIRKLNQMNDGYTYRLPTEAEWEYACRAGTTGDYAGDLNEMAWYSENSGREPHAVGMKQPNAWGLYDMHGNVAEWCEDWYHETYDDAPRDGSAWLSGGTQKYRMVRGGSWHSESFSLSSASRSVDTPDVVLNYVVGFRVVAIARTQ